MWHKRSEISDRIVVYDGAGAGLDVEAWVAVDDIC